MAGFRVDPEGLLAVVDRMAAFDRDVEAILLRASSVTESLGANWSGEASEAERAAYQQWEIGAADMRDALSRLRAMAEGAHANYQGAIRQNSQMWS